MFGWFKNQKAVKPRAEARTAAVRYPVVRSKYDAAQTTTNNERHWSMADSLGPNLAASPTVRTTLRNRSRYETANNSYLKGIVQTLADYQIGTGPRLQMLTRDEKANGVVEELFADWCEAIDFAGKLWTMRVGMVVDGEAFAVMITNPKLPTPVKLDLRLIEPEMVATPMELYGNPNVYDGIEYDRYGNVVAYYVLDEHPNDVRSHIKQTYRRYLAADVIHWFRPVRAGQKRGVPETAPTLNTIANMRRYTAAVLGAAEIAASNAMVLYTDSPAGQEAADVEAMDAIELENRLATVLPEGWKLGQMQAEQPTTTYTEFKKEVINEIARSFLMPYNIAAGNSAGYNYASGRLDHQAFFRHNKVLQKSLTRNVIDLVFRSWMMEAILHEDLIPLSIKALPKWPHQWFFDGHEHVDPAKEAKAQDIHLKNLTTTYAEEYAKKGKDWQVELEQAAREKEFMKTRGITAEDVAQQKKSVEEE